MGLIAVLNFTGNVTFSNVNKQLTQYIKAQFNALTLTLQGKYLSGKLHDLLCTGIFCNTVASKITYIVYLKNTPYCNLLKHMPCCRNTIVVADNAVAAR